MSEQETYDQKTDEEIVALVFQNKEIYGELVKRYEQKLLRFLRSTARLDKQEYEDILQNAFLKAYLNLRDFDTSLKFSSWLYRIVHNEMIDHLRRKKTGGNTASLDAEDEDTLKLIDILADDTDLSREVDQKMLSKRVKDVLKTLSVEYREVLILRYYEDKDYAEISDILKKPMGTVATLLNRAKEQLREKMSGREQLTGGA